MKRCQTGKVSYPSSHYAKIARSSITAKKNFRIYKCEQCYSYHLTSQQKSTKW